MLNKIEKQTILINIKYNQIGKTNYTNQEDGANTFKEDYKQTAKDFAGVGSFALSFDTHNQTMAKAGKLSISAELCERVKKMAGVILKTNNANKVQATSNNATRKAIAFAICKNATSHYKPLAKTSDAKLYAERVGVACWSTLLQIYFEILTDFGKCAIYQKINGDIEILTANKMRELAERMTKQAETEKQARKQARKNEKTKATEQAKAKAEKTATKGEKKAKTSKAKAKA